MEVGLIPPPTPQITLQMFRGIKFDRIYKNVIRVLNYFHFLKLKYLSDTVRIAWGRYVVQMALDALQGLSGFQLGDVAQYFAQSLILRIAR